MKLCSLSYIVYLYEVLGKALSSLQVKEIVRLDGKNINPYYIHREKQQFGHCLKRLFRNLADVDFFTRFSRDLPLLNLAKLCINDEAYFLAEACCSRRKISVSVLKAYCILTLRTERPLKRVSLP